MGSINIHSVTKLVAFPLIAWSGYEMASMYNGVILLPIAIILSTVIYLVAYDFLFRVLSPKGELGPLVATRPTQSLMGGVALLFALLLIVLWNRILIISSDPTTAIVTKKTMWTSAKQSCAELKLQDNSTHCVDMVCWNRASIGEYITLTPQAGLFGLRKMNTNCQIANLSFKRDWLKPAHLIQTLCVFGGISVRL